MRITVLDGRQLVGRFLAFDRHMNIVLGDAEEFRRLPPKKGVPEADREVRRPLGLVLIRGESVISLTVEGPPPTDDRRGKRDVAPVRACLRRSRACQHPPLGFNLLSLAPRLPCSPSPTAGRAPGGAGQWQGCRPGCARACAGAGCACRVGWACAWCGGAWRRSDAPAGTCPTAAPATGNCERAHDADRLALTLLPQISAAPQMGLAPGMRPPGMPPQFMPPPGSASRPRLVCAMTR